MTDQIITQVTPENFTGVRHDDSQSNIDYNSKINLNIRGRKFTITRDELMSLPESILLCLFPNGVFLDEKGHVISNLTEDDVVFINFEPACFEYIFDKFSEANRDLLDMPNLSPQISSGFGRNQENFLQNKPAIIVLREDLDFYVIPQAPGLDSDQIRHLKLDVGSNLLQSDLIFKGLGYDTDLHPTTEQKLGPAEQHLFDMLCSSGFEPREIWGSRSIEPSKCVISSLSLVRLKSGHNTPPESPSLNPITSNSSVTSRSRSRIASLASSASRAASRSMSKSKKSESNHTKLLLFWRKPARKCWWSNQTMNIDLDSTALKIPESSIEVKVHIRRVWTLELSVIGVQ